MQDDGQVWNELDTLIRVHTQTIFMTSAQVRGLLSVSQMWLTRHVAEGTFPAPFKLADHKTSPLLWRRDVVEAFLAEREAS